MYHQCGILFFRFLLIHEIRLPALRNDWRVLAGPKKFEKSSSATYECFRKTANDPVLNYFPPAILVNFTAVLVLSKKLANLDTRFEMVCTNSVFRGHSGSHRVLDLGSWMSNEDAQEVVLSACF